MAVPKRKMSRANTRHRRAQRKAIPTELTPVATPDGRTAHVPRRMARAVRRGLAEPLEGSVR